MATRVAPRPPIAASIWRDFGSPKRKRFLLKWPSRSKGSCEQDRPEKEDDLRAADGAGGPHRVGPGAIRASELERKLARAERECRQRRDGDGSAERHGEGRGHARPEEALGDGKDEHENGAGAGPDADREHHGHDLAPGERSRQLPRIDDMVAGLSRRVMVTVMRIVVVVMVIAVMVVDVMVVGVIVVVMIVVTMRGGVRRGLSCRDLTPTAQEPDELGR